MNNFIRHSNVSALAFSPLNNPTSIVGRFVWNNAADDTPNLARAQKLEKDERAEIDQVVREELVAHGADVIKVIKNAAKDQLANYAAYAVKNPTATAFPTTVTVGKDQTPKQVFLRYDDKNKPESFGFSADGPFISFDSTTDRHALGTDWSLDVSYPGGKKSSEYTYDFRSKKDGEIKKGTIKNQGTKRKETFKKFGSFRDGNGLDYEQRIAVEAKRQTEIASQTKSSKSELTELRELVAELRKPSTPIIPYGYPAPYNYAPQPNFSMASFSHTFGQAELNRYVRSCHQNGQIPLTTAYPQQSYGGNYQYRYHSPVSPSASYFRNRPLPYAQQVENIENKLNASGGTAQLFDEALIKAITDGKTPPENVVSVAIEYFLQDPRNKAFATTYRNYLSHTASDPFKENLAQRAENFASGIAIAHELKHHKELSKNAWLKLTDGSNAPDSMKITLFEQVCKLQESVVSFVLQNYNLPAGSVDKLLKNAGEQTGNTPNTGTNTGTNTNTSTSTANTSSTTNPSATPSTKENPATKPATKPSVIEQEITQVTNGTDKAVLENIYKGTSTTSVEQKTKMQEILQNSVLKHGIDLDLYADTKQYASKPGFTEVDKSLPTFSAEYTKKLLEGDISTFMDLSKASESVRQTEQIQRNPVTETATKDAIKKTADHLSTIVKNVPGTTTKDLIKFVQAKKEAVETGTDLTKVLKDKSTDGVFSTSVTKAIKDETAAFETITKTLQNEEIHTDIVHHYTEDGQPILERVHKDQPIDNISIVTVTRTITENGQIETVPVVSDHRIEYETYEHETGITETTEGETGGITETTPPGGNTGITAEPPKPDTPIIPEKPVNPDVPITPDPEFPVDPTIEEQTETEGSHPITVDEIPGQTGVRYEWNYKVEGGGTITHNPSQIGRITLNYDTKRIAKTVTVNETVVVPSKAQIVGKHSVESWCTETCKRNNDTGTVSGLGNYLLKDARRRGKGIPSNLNINNIKVRYYNHPSYAKQLAKTKKHLDWLRGKNYQICKGSNCTSSGTNYSLANIIPNATNSAQDCQQIDYYEKTGVNGFDLLLKGVGQTAYLEKINGVYTLVISGSDYRGCSSGTHTETRQVQKTEYVTERRYTGATYVEGSWQGQTDPSNPKAKEKRARLDSITNEVKAKWTEIFSKDQTLLNIYNNASGNKYQAVAKHIASTVGVSQYTPQTYTWTESNPNGNTVHTYTFTQTKAGQNQAQTFTGNTEIEAWNQLQKHQPYKDLKAAKTGFEENDVRKTSGQFEKITTNPIVKLDQTTAKALDRIITEVKTAIANAEAKKETPIRIVLNYGNFDGAGFTGGSEAEREQKQTLIYRYLTGETVDELKTNNAIDKQYFGNNTTPPYGGQLDASLGEQIQIKYSNKTGDKKKITENSPDGEITQSNNDEAVSSHLSNVPDIIQQNASLFGNLTELSKLMPPKDLKLTIGGKNVSIQSALNKAHAAATNPTKTNVLGLKQYQKFYEILTTEPGGQYVRHFLSKLSENARNDSKLLNHLSNNTGITRLLENTSGPLSLNLLETIAEKQINVEPKFRQADFWGNLFDPYEPTNTYLGDAISWVKNAVGNVFETIADFETHSGMALYKSGTNQAIDTDGDGEARIFHTFADIASGLHDDLSFGDITRNTA